MLQNEYQDSQNFKTETRSNRGLPKNAFGMTNRSMIYHDSQLQAADPALLQARVGAFFLVQVRTVNLDPPGSGITSESLSTSLNPCSYQAT
jgi:hypothetical protein